MVYFYPRPPRGGRHQTFEVPEIINEISIHALREEGDSTAGIMCRRPTNFYPRPPRGGRRETRKPTRRRSKFLSTPSARRATESISIGVHLLIISIHALREEGDNLPAVFRAFSKDFYPRPPRGGRLFIAVVKTRCFYYFYPRPPRGGRHRVGRAAPGFFTFLSTPSARRATLWTGAEKPGGQRISIHALREEGD